MTQALPSGAERSPPPTVPPLQHQGVRYQQDLSGQEPAGSAPGGTLAAFDVASGQRLWLLQVYTVRDDPGAPMRHPGIYFRSLALVPDSGELEIENEVGGLYRVDLAKRQARELGGPPERAAPSTPGKPKPSP